MRTFLHCYGQPFRRIGTYALIPDWFPWFKVGQNEGECLGLMSHLEVRLRGCCQEDKVRLSARIGHFLGAVQVRTPTPGLES